MAKTNKQPRTKSGKFAPKTPAPKKKPTLLALIYERTGRHEASLTRLADRIGKLELYGTANVDSWIEQHDNRIKDLERRLDKLASPTVAVEEVKPLKAGDWFMVVRTWNCGYKVGDVIQAIRVDEGGDPWFAPTRYYDGEICLSVIRKELRAATPEEIAAHEAKLKAEAQAAEDAKLVFGARVESVRNRIEYRLACDSPDANGKYRLAPKQACHYDAPMLERHEFTLLP